MGAATAQRAGRASDDDSRGKKVDRMKFWNWLDGKQAALTGMAVERVFNDSLKIAPVPSEEALLGLRSKRLSMMGARK